MFPLCSACTDTMNQGRHTHSDVDQCRDGIWVVDEVRKAVDMGYVLVDLFQVWDYEVICSDKDTNLGVCLRSTETCS